MSDEIKQSIQLERERMKYTILWQSPKVPMSLLIHVYEWITPRTAEEIGRSKISFHRWHIGQEDFYLFPKLRS